MTTENNAVDEMHSINQKNILRFFDQLTDDQQALLRAQLQKFPSLAKLCYDYRKAVNAHVLPAEELKSKIHQVPAEAYSSAKNCGQETLDNYWNKGLQAISKGEVGVILMAGGQGTRLGVSYPKGMYNVGLPSQKSLFQLQAEKILRLQTLASQSFPDSLSIIPWYIMTSESTQKATRDFFQSQSYFGLQENQVTFFEQGAVPCFDFEGNILLDSSFHVSTAPDGNGGMYKALYKSDCLDNMRSRKVQFVHAYCVDNILVRVADPVFVGYCIENDADCGNKVVEKRSYDESVGVVCKVDGVGYTVVEYSEMPDGLNRQVDAQGRLVFRAGNIANHFFSFEFLSDICTKHCDKLIYHVAKKKIPFLNEQGQLCKPEKPNGIKLEKFVFDVFPYAKRFFVWEVAREDEFSPLKNATGCDSPETCCSDVYNLHRKWLQKEGGSFSVKNEPRTANKGQKELPPTPLNLELSPLVTYRGEDLAEYVRDHEKLKELLQS